MSSLNQILIGPAGCGKTRIAMRLAVMLADPAWHGDQYQAPMSAAQAVSPDSALEERYNDLLATGQVVFTRFHPSFSYGDFMEAVLPPAMAQAAGTPIRDGLFKALIRRAESRPERQFVFVIDQINATDPCHVFGEALSLLAARQRGMSAQLSLQLPLSRCNLSLPNNLSVIAIHSGQMTDLATPLLSSFDLIRCEPLAEVLEYIDIFGVDLAELLDALNTRIKRVVGADFALGHEHFVPLLDTELGEQEQQALLSQLFAQRVIPYLQQICQGDLAKVALILNDAVKPEHAHFFRAYGSTPNARYEINPDAFEQPDAYRLIVG